MPKKNYSFEVDWTESVSKSFKKHDPKKSILDYGNLKNLTYTLPINIASEKTNDWTDGDERSFKKLVESRFKLSSDKVDSKISPMINDFWKAHVVTVGGVTGFKTPKTREKDVNTLLFQIDQLLTKEFNKLVDYTEKTMHQYFKGKARKGRLAVQSVKHAVKPIAAPALFVVGATLSTNPFTFPAGALALKAAAQSLKDSWDFFNKKYQSTRELEASMKKNLEYLLDKAGAMEKIQNEMEDLVKKGEQDSPRHKWLYLQYKEKALTGKNREAKAVLKKEFLSMHSKSIENLKLLVHKYKKKIEQLVYQVAHLGSKQDTIETLLDNMKTHRDRDVAYIAKLKKELQKSGEDEVAGVQALISVADGQLAKSKKQIDKMEDKLKLLQNNDAHRDLVTKQKLLNKMEKQLDLLKDGRSEDIHAFKKIVRAMNITTDMIGSGAGVGFDYAAPMTAVNQVVVASGNVLDFGEQLNTGAKTLKQKLKL